MKVFSGSNPGHVGYGTAFADELHQVVGSEHTKLMPDSLKHYELRSTMSCLENAHHGSRSHTKHGHCSGIHCWHLGESIPSACCEKDVLEVQLLSGFLQRGHHFLPSFIHFGTGLLPSRLSSCGRPRLLSGC